MIEGVAQVVSPTIAVHHCPRGQVSVPSATAQTDDTVLSDGEVVSDAQPLPQDRDIVQCDTGSHGVRSIHRSDRIKAFAHRPCCQAGNRRRGFARDLRPLWLTCTSWNGVGLTSESTFNAN